jgi:hypothetical protein
VLIRDGAVEYRSRIVVLALEERGAQVEVTMRRLDSPERLTLQFDCVFVAAGPVNTTRIMLQSRNYFDQWVDLRDSQKFAIPLIRLRRSPLEWPDSNTLASVFLEAKLPRLHDHWVHMQISAVNDYVLHRFGLRDEVAAWRKCLFMPMAERLMAAWCSLHSDDSDGVRLRLSSARCGDEHVLELEPIKRPETARAVRTVGWNMVSLGLRFRTLFLAPLTMSIEPGGGSHTGGSFPMRWQRRTAFETDTLGRPTGCSHIHLVDSSVFPSIPATTIALVVMANADRIASAAPLN